jgi:hypothetical protein
MVWKMAGKREHWKVETLDLAWVEKTDEMMVEYLAWRTAALKAEYLVEMMDVSSVGMMAV